MSDAMWVACWLVPIIIVQLIEKWKTKKEHDALVKNLIFSKYTTEQVDNA